VGNPLINRLNSPGLWTYFGIATLIGLISKVEKWEIRSLFLYTDENDFKQSHNSSIIQRIQHVGKISYEYNLEINI